MITILKELTQESPYIKENSVSNQYSSEIIYIKHSDKKIWVEQMTFHLMEMLIVYKFN